MFIIVYTCEYVHLAIYKYYVLISAANIGHVKEQGNIYG